MSFILLLLLILILGAVLVAGGIAFGAMAVKRNAENKLEVAPGVPSKAPANWVGAHSEEAKLHRRLVTATTSLRRTADLEPSLNASVAGIEAEAIRLDAELVNASMLSPDLKAKVLARLAEAVAAIEGVVERAVLNHDRGTLEPAPLKRELEAFDDQIVAIRQAWEEIDEIDPPGTPQPG